MRYSLISAVFLFVSTGWSQDNSVGGSKEAGPLGRAQPLLPVDASQAAQPKIVNPFDSKLFPGGDGMGMMAGMGGQNDIAEMMTGGMGEAEFGPSADDLFRQGLQRAIYSLNAAQTDEQKEIIRGYIREAFEDRYLKMISERKRDLEKLKASVAKLESDLERREAAKDRVVQVQMQSVQLAAEGLLELGDLQGVGHFAAPGMGGMGSGFGNDPLNN